MEAIKNFSYYEGGHLIYDLWMVILIFGFTLINNLIIWHGLKKRHNTPMNEFPLFELVLSFALAVLLANIDNMIAKSVLAGMFILVALILDGGAARLVRQYRILVLVTAILVGYSLYFIPFLVALLIYVMGKLSPKKRTA